VGSASKLLKVCAGSEGVREVGRASFYLTAIAVDPGLREKYAKIYRNY